MNFILWLEDQEVEDSFRDQLATAMNMQSQKDVLNKLDIDTFRQPIEKALNQSKGTFLQRIPAERFMAAQQWVRTAKGRTIGDLIGVLSGRESVDSAVPAKKTPSLSPPVQPVQQMATQQVPGVVPQ